MTIQEINKLYEMLSSKDKEMQNLGLNLARAKFAINGIPSTHDIETIKAVLAWNAYVEGATFANKMKETNEKENTGNAGI